MPRPHRDEELERRSGNGERTEAIEGIRRGVAVAEDGETPASPRWAGLDSEGSADSRRRGRTKGDGNRCCAAMILHDRVAPRGHSEGIPEQEV